MRKEFEILREAQDWDISEIPPLSTFLDRTIFGITAEKCLSAPHELSAIIDVRSEDEYKESRLPGAISFPILNNCERREVGILYKKLSQKHAVAAALKFAEPKIASLKALLSKHYQSDKPFAICCWRGGGRSGYTASLIKQLNFPVMKVQGGYKAYRNLVHHSLYEKKCPPLIILKGLTGVGKTELLEKIEGHFKMLNLEYCARNTASSFGRIPYQLKGEFFLVSQKYFEDQIFQNLYLKESRISKMGIPVESESRRIGNVFIPPSILEAMADARVIMLQCSMEQRVERIYRDYIGEKEKGAKFLVDCLPSLKRYIEGNIYSQFLEAVEKNDWRQLIELLLSNYYDKKYKGSYSNEFITIDTTDMEKAQKQLIEILSTESSNMKDDGS
jgi:tRNA 2-selenouridine synthase